MKYKTLLSTATLALTFSAPAQAAIWTSGHGDIGLEGDGGILEFEAHLGEDEPAIVDGAEVFDTGYDPGDIEIAAFNRQTITSSNTVLLNGLGITSGDSIHLLPNSATLAANFGTPFVGFGLEELSPGDWGDITFSLIGVSGPGDFSVYQGDGLGNFDFFMSTALGGIDGDDAFTLSPGVHDHFNLAFTESGDYSVTFEASGTYLPDGELRSTSGTFNFSAVPEPSSALLLGLGAFAVVIRRRRVV